MSYPTKLLGEDEELVLELHPHWKALVLPVLTAVVLAGAGSFALARVGGHTYTTGARWAIAALLVVLGLWRCVWPWLTWLTTLYVVTDRRVIIRTGVLSRQGRDIPMSRVNDVTFSHTLWERLLSCGTLTVESAGERGQVVLAEVPRVEEVQRTVFKLAEEDEERRRGSVGVG